MPAVTFNAEVWIPPAQKARVSKPAASTGTVHKLGARVGAPAGVYYITASVPAGAMQAEDDSYLLTEDSNYLEVE